MKQSSIDWFVRETWELRMQLEKKELTLGEYATKYYALYEQADAMHKEEIVDALINGMHKGQDIYFSEGKVKLDVNSLNYCIGIAEDYYNETFNSKEK